MSGVYIKDVSNDIFVESLTVSETEVEYELYPSDIYAISNAKLWFEDIPAELFTWGKNDTKGLLVNLDSGGYNSVKKDQYDSLATALAIGTIDSATIHSVKLKVVVPIYADGTKVWSIKMKIEGQ